MKKIAFALIVLTLGLAACKPEKGVEVPKEDGVYIVNEGNFNFGTAEISFYNPEKKQVTNGLFAAANNYALGDVAQSFFIKDTLGFIVVNNSQKIEVVKVPGFKKMRTISIPASSPRYFLPVNDSIAYVTDLYAAKLHVVNYVTGALIKQIAMPTAWGERMVANGNEVMVEARELSSSGSHNAALVVINAVSHTITASYKLNAANVDGIGRDGYGNVWVAKGIDTTAQLPAVLYRLSSNYAVLDSAVLGAGHSTGPLHFNAAGDHVYFLDNDVYSLSTQVGATPQLLVPRNGRNFYGMAVDPSNGDIYVADALDFIQPSRVYRYSKNGDLIDSFTAGLISGNFAFSYE